MAETGAAADMGENARTNLTTLQRIKAILGGSAGNLVEWYDWFAYTSFTIYFASSFFPEGDTTAKFLQAALLNMVSFLARPVGAWAMGALGDRYGRKNALIISVVMMCAGSLIIAFCPTFQQVGVLAPVILGVARLVQGLSIGGQYGASATYMSEMATRKHRGFWSSFQYVTLIAGQLVALIVLIVMQHLMPEAQIKAGGWRIAFFIGAALALVVFFIQSSLHETDAYKNAKKAGKKGGTLVLFTEHPRAVFTIMALTAGGTTAFYAYTTYMLKFLQNTAHFSKTDAASINFWMLLIYMCAQPAFGYLSDKIGRKITLTASFGVGALVAFPIFTAVAQSTDMVTAGVLTTIPLLILSGYTSLSAVVKAEMLPAHVRTLGVAFPYAISNAIFGALVEPAALRFKQVGHESYFYWYVAGLMVLGFAAALTLRDTQKHSLIHED